jgi:hypothetical protein
MFEKIMLTKTRLELLTNEKRGVIMRARATFDAEPPQALAIEIQLVDVNSLRKRPSLPPPTAPTNLPNPLSFASEDTTQCYGRL